MRNGVEIYEGFSVLFEYLFLEILVKIMFFLVFKDIFLFEIIFKKLLNVMLIYLRIRKVVDFMEGKWYGEMFLFIIDVVFLRLLK